MVHHHTGSHCVGGNSPPAGQEGNQHVRQRRQHPTKPQAQARNASRESTLWSPDVCHGWVEAVLGITSSIWLRNNCAHKSLCVNTYSGAPPPAIRSARLQVTRGDGLPAVVNPAPSITTYPKKW